MEQTTYAPGVQARIDQGAQATEQMMRHRAAMRGKKFETIAVHGVYGMASALNNQGSIIEPAYFSTAQHFEDSDHMEASLAYLMPGWIYSRVANPTVGYLEQTLALLEGYGFEGEVSACATASGMAAVFMATSPFLSQESGPATGRPNIVASANCYGGTFQLFTERYGRERGVEIRWVRDPLNLEEWAARINDDTRFVYAEMPSNPGLAVFDITALADLAHGHDLPLIVDSTVATPALMRPLCYGADIVVQSVSKSMSSGGLTIAGAVIARQDIPSRVGPPEMREDFALYLKLFPFRDYGPAHSPVNALLILNDLRTLRSKMDLLSRNAMAVAEFLAAQPQVERVFYPGLPDTPEHEIARRYMWLVDSETDDGGPVNRFGHLLSFTIGAGPAATRRFFDRLQMIWRATDLGRIKSVATIPAISTHQQQGEAGRDLASIPPTMVRLNVGGEHVSDVIRDLEQALAGID